MLENIIGSLNLRYVDVDGVSYDKILGLFKDGVIFEPSRACEFFYVGSYYKYVKKDEDTAFSNYYQAAELGDIMGMYASAVILNKRGDTVSAEIYYKKAADLGHIDSMCVLANIYRNVKMNYELAEIYYGKASALGYASAMNNLAVIYEYDKNDYEQAEVYYKKAAELGNMIGLWNLGRFYDERRKNYALAEFYLHQFVQSAQTDKPACWPDAVIAIFNIYRTTLKFEEAFLWAHQYKDVIKSENMIWALKKITHPISKHHQEKIYTILEKLNLPPGADYTEQLF